MAPSRTGRLFPPPEEESTTTPACTLPYDLVLEIVARSDVATVVRSAATCKSLRRAILSPGFIRQQHGQNGGGVPPLLVGYLRVPSNSKAGGKRTALAACFSLVHPATPAATSFSEDHLAPFLSRRAAADLGRRYVPLTSRNGLVVLRRGWSDICIYDPMTGNRAYLPPPPKIGNSYREGYGVYHTYVLLTAADGIGSCCFLLLATDSSVSRIQIVSSSGAAADGTCTWGPLISVAEPELYYRRYADILPHSCAVVLDGLIHWLMCTGYVSPRNCFILTYDVPRHGTRPATTTGSIEIPEACLPDGCQKSEVHLTTSPDGMLSLLVADRFTISVWLLSRFGGVGRRWARQSVIDTEAIVWSMSPHELPESEWPSKVDFVRSVGLRSGVVLLRPFMSWDFLNDKGKKGLLLVDVGTEEMRRVDKKEGFPYEVDMEARLSAMKIFD